jgi:hypothetical protein
LGYTGIAGQTIEVNELANASGAEANEALKESEILNL